MRVVVPFVQLVYSRSLDLGRYEWGREVRDDQKKLANNELPKLCQRPVSAQQDRPIAAAPVILDFERCIAAEPSVLHALLRIYLTFKCTE